MAYHDFYENILIHLDINDIVKMCTLEKNSPKICHDFDFWICKFKHDNLPILSNLLPTNMKGWMREYKKVKHCYNIALLIFEVLKQQKLNYFYMIYDPEDPNVIQNYDNFYNLLPDIGLIYNPLEKMGVYVDELTEIMFDFLVRMLYYVPDIIIVKPFTFDLDRIFALMTFQRYFPKTILYKRTSKTPIPHTFPTNVVIIMQNKSFLTQVG